VNLRLDKIGTVSIWIGALSCPACFPALISLVSLLGLGFLSVFESLAINLLLPLFAVISLLSNLHSWSGYKNNFIGAFIVLSPILVLLILYPLWEYSWSAYLFYGAISLMSLILILDVSRPIRQ
jgi:mercuric ion transport protein